MSRVQKLSDDLVSKIAAGEVVERPASIVKELIENALDAGANQIQVEIDEGGKALIRVRDDGCGMDRADARLAVERHATSKLRTLSDLEAVATHGFRGEALAAIASVSELRLCTRDEASPAGTEVEVLHGRLTHVQDIGHPRGTTVEVRDLFGAVPARRKFLRAASTETSHVVEVVTSSALAFPLVGFALTSAGRAALLTPAAGDRAGRIYQIFGDALVEDMLPIDASHGWVRVSGYTSRPDRPAPLRSAIRLFVNGRAVRDRALAKAVSEAYRKAGVGDPRPEAFVFLELPFARVDVNVHPAKTEVRFADPRLVWDAVEAAVRQSLSAGSRRTLPAIPEGAGPGEERRGAGDAGGAPWVSRGFPDRDVWTSGLGPAAEAGTRLAEPSSEYLPGPVVLGQHRKTYIVATDGEEILLVDQHTAHERSRYELLIGQLAARKVESQLLLTPQVVTLEPRLLPLVGQHGELLQALGFGIEDFGGTALRLSAVPALLAGRDLRTIVGGILGDLLEREATDWAVSGAHERLAATIACHSAVRAGQALSSESMGAIVRGLLATQDLTYCPHGRPTLVRLPKEDVSRWFGRKGWRRE